MTPAHLVVVSNWRPTPLNQLLGHWAKAARLKKGDRDVVAFAMHLHEVPEAECKRKVSLLVAYAKGQRKCDPDAFWKSTLDALTACGAIVDDTDDWVELGNVAQMKAAQGTPYTCIILRDLCPPTASAKSRKRSIKGRSSLGNTSSPS